jgi:hypothetical protein
MLLLDLFERDAISDIENLIKYHKGQLKRHIGNKNTAMIKSVQRDIEELQTLQKKFQK